MPPTDAVCSKCCLLVWLYPPRASGFCSFRDKKELPIFLPWMQLACWPPSRAAAFSRVRQRNRILLLNKLAIPSFSQHYLANEPLLCNYCKTYTKEHHAKEKSLAFHLQTYAKASFAKAAFLFCVLNSWLFPPVSRAEEKKEATPRLSRRSWRSCRRGDGLGRFIIFIPGHRVRTKVL